MASHNKIDTLNEQYEEALFRLVMNDVAKVEGQQFLNEYESSTGRNSYVVPSEASIDRFTRLLDKNLKKRKLTKQHKFVFLHRIAVASLVLLIAFSTMMVTVQAFRVQVLNFLIRIEPDFTEYQLQDKDDTSEENESLVVSWKNAYVPTYIPKGYDMVEATFSNSVKKILFKNTADNSLVYTEYEADSNITTDTEGASLIETIKINDQNGTLSIKGSTTTIVWKMDQSLFIIQGEVSQDEAVKIAEGVKFLK